MKHNQTQRRAYVLIQVALVMVVLLGFVALSVDYGMMVVRQRHLQNVTDSAALAAGPDLMKSASIPIQVAQNYAGYNGTPGAAATVANSAITVTATENVPTPFAAVMNSAWGTRPVSATSVVQASRDMDITTTDLVTGSGGAAGSMLRPVGIQAGPVGPSGADKYLGLNGHKVTLTLNLNGNLDGYSNNNGFTVIGGDITVDMVPIDLSAAGISGTSVAVDKALLDYKTALKGGVVTPVIDQKGGTYWLASAAFVTGSGKNFIWTNPNTRLGDLEKWRDASYAAIAADGEDGSILRQVAALRSAGATLPDDPAFDAAGKVTNGWPAKEDPRQCIFLECNRTTGNGTSKAFDMALQGYVGFFISGISDDHTKITGYFVDPVMRSRRLPPSGTTSSGTTYVTVTLPPVVNYGIYSYNLTQ